MNYYNFYTEIEEHFVRRRGKHMFVSPLDWSLIETWKQTGVPLHVALRGIDIAMDTWFSKPHRTTDRLSTLFYCHDAVMQEYARHLEAQVGASREEASSATSGNRKPESDVDPGLAKEDVLRFLDARIAEIKTLLAKHRDGETEQVLLRVGNRLEELAGGILQAEMPEFESLDRDLGILDELLVAGLKPLVAEEESDAWQREARQELKIYKKRLGKETYQRIVDNFIRGRIRRHFHVGELSLFHMQSSS